MIRLAGHSGSGSQPRRSRGRRVRATVRIPGDGSAPHSSGLRPPQASFSRDHFSPEPSRETRHNSSGGREREPAESFDREVAEAAPHVLSKKVALNRRNEPSGKRRGRGGAGSRWKPEAESHGLEKRSLHTHTHTPSPTPQHCLLGLVVRRSPAAGPPPASRLCRWAWPHPCGWSNALESPRRPPASVGSTQSQQSVNMRALEGVFLGEAGPWDAAALWPFPFERKALAF